MRSGCLKQHWDGIYAHTIEIFILLTHSELHEVFVLLSEHVHEEVGYLKLLQEVHVSWVVGEVGQVGQNLLLRVYKRVICYYIDLNRIWMKRFRLNFVSKWILQMRDGAETFLHSSSREHSTMKQSNNLNKYK